MIFLFVLARHGLVLINGRTLFDLLLVQVNEKHLSLRIKTTQRVRRNQHLAVGQPSTGVGDQIANGPGFVVEVEVSDVPNLAIGGPQFFSVTLLNAVQHQKTFLFLLNQSSSPNKPGSFCKLSYPVRPQRTLRAISNKSKFYLIYCIPPFMI